MTKQASSKQFPILQNMAEGKEIVWLNPDLKSFATIADTLPFNTADMDDTEARFKRFAPFLAKVFPETMKTHGLIQSPLAEIDAMKTILNDKSHAQIEGKLYLKLDSNLAVAGSVKARGGIYEILKHAEDLALAHNLIALDDDYSVFASQAMRDFLGKYSVHVGSTGNLGLSIGIISATLGFKVYVHMSADAKQWKKDLLRQKGVNVIEYHGDYGKAVAKGRELAQKDDTAYFVDDENSANLFLGYSLAARELQAQLNDKNITVDENHPLFVYIPCGVGGAPGGITFGLKQVFKDNVYVFFVEPTNACCMALGMITKKHDKICVQDIGLNGITEADGLAVNRPSKLVGKIMTNLLAGEFTISDDKLYFYEKNLLDSENIFIEPSSCAAFMGVNKIFTDKLTQVFLAKYNLTAKMANSLHIIWATGGSLVPQPIRQAYYQKAIDLGY